MADQVLGSVNFDQFIGLEASLYYHNILNQFQLGSVVFEVMEDEDDGYRSSMKEVVIIDKDAKRLEGNFLGIVHIESDEEDNFSGYRIRDKNTGHIWLKFGTDNSDDYYPSFTFYFTPVTK